MTSNSRAGEPPELDGYRTLADELLDDGEPARAEAVLREAVQRWPARLGLRLKLARSIEAQGRDADARATIEQLVLERDELPVWARPTVANFGYTIANGVKLDLADEVITPYMRDHLVSGGYEKTECELMSSVLAAGDVILEVGGGIGFISTYALLAEPSATVVSYEANPALMAVAARTQQLNGVSFEMRNAMLGAQAGTSDFIVNKAFWASSATHDYGGGSVIQVSVESVADVMAEKPFNMVVMDIEGGEIELVPEMDLSTVDRFVLETHPNITGDRAVRRMLKQLKSDFGLRSRREVGGVHLLVRR